MKSIKLKLKSFPVWVFLATLLVITSIWLIIDITIPKIPILGFHSIVDTKKLAGKNNNQNFPKIDYTKGDFGEVLDYLVKHNFWFISSQELYDYFIFNSRKIPSEHIGQRPIMLTFDDSYKTFYTDLLPVLESIANKYNQKVKVVLFINPGRMANHESKTSYNITCNNLREGLEKGFFDIQSHGENHKKLTDLNTKDLIYELETAQLQLRKCTAGLDPNQTVASHLAYPYGASNPRVEKFAARYYKSAYLYNSRFFWQGWLKNKYQIPRLTVNHQKAPKGLIYVAEKALKIKGE
ncbi:polysaccharide deacetylase family protein [Phormidium sp. LEGE 05292]|uniref:polysaccharide deacetylase family protein n=1 Tax=[Phormidium] sp. LEGE 05292 TaxID=767427 RepID=UPI00187E5864|nr:polysaccharide deacetylase family protein [Phormidium sp. LEGE 05292]MBE9227926.1 polysaccharide deacetylase family protein [Phormidium sp. LEGE 05292]